jgi:hypothetical protein
MAVDGTLTGEVCHIRGLRSGSARYHPAQTDVERHAYANLVLMCPTHHTVIDDDDDAYSVERLYKIKATHEAQSTPIPDAEAAAVAQVITQSVTNIGQSGGLSAHTVYASTKTHLPRVISRGSVKPRQSSTYGRRYATWAVRSAPLPWSIRLLPHRNLTLTSGKEIPLPLRISFANMRTEPFPFVSWSRVLKMQTKSARSLVIAYGLSFSYCEPSTVGLPFSWAIPIRKADS